jgi:hypothetical protein
MSVAGAIFAVVGTVLVAGNLAITGDWNFHGGGRRTFCGSFPFQVRAVQWEDTAQDRAANRVLWDHIVDHRVFWTMFSHNGGYFTTVSRGRRSQRVEMAAHATAPISLPLDEGFPYIGTRVWRVSIRSSAGFVLFFVTPGSQDTRFLGVQVTPESRH